MNIAETFSRNHTKEGSFNIVTFNRNELNRIFKVYGKMVQKGEWRDYGISSLKTKAIFSVFRRTAEHPLYMIVKNQTNSKKHGLFTIVAMDGHILKRGNNLKVVLDTFNRKLLTVI